MVRDPDPAALRRWLAMHVPGGGPELSVRRVEGGQSNPTWFVDWGPRRLVLRRQPDGPILPGAHAVDREFRVLRALEQSEVPVPRALHFEQDASVLGRPFYVMERLEGRVFADCALPGLTRAERRAVYLDMARTLARLHAVRPEAVGLAGFGRPGSYFARQVARWSRQYAESPGPRVAAIDRLVEWLPANLPPDDGSVAIVHGDFRLGNLMFHAREPKVIAVLDWELSTLGHPMADLAFAVIPWRSAPEEYGGLLGTDWRGAGIPDEAGFVAEYQAHAPAAGPLLPVHVAFALFRFAVIFHGIADRARAGSAVSGRAATLGPLAERLALRALEALGGG
jgi:aminoglycoside phosphotransferase (APT) family kinase protein